MSSEFEEIRGADGTTHVLQHQIKDLNKAQAILLLSKFKKAWEDSALAIVPDRVWVVPDRLERMHFRRTWVTRFVNGRPYHRTASNRKRRKRYYRNR